MADWRAIHRRITHSWDVSQLSTLGKLLFTWGIVCADNYGILEDDPGAIKLEILAGVDCTPEEIEEQLQLMEQRELIWRYNPNGMKPLIQFRCFDEYQPREMLRKRGRSKWPVHAEWEPPDDVELRVMPEKAGQCPTMPAYAPREIDRQKEEVDREKEQTEATNPNSNSNIKWWQFIQAMEQVQGSRDTVSQWFTHGRIAEVTDEYVLIQIPNPRYAEFINDRAMHRVQQAVDSLWDGNREARLEAMPPT